jgi:hypothetical protein
MRQKGDFRQGLFAAVTADGTIRAWKPGELSGGRRSADYPAPCSRRPGDAAWREAPGLAAARARGLWEVV